MGQRANLVVVHDGAWQLYYSHWRANTLDKDLFWGPAYAAAFIRSQRPCEPTEWLDEVWAEGGAVLDLDRRVILFYGGEDVLYELPRRQIHLAIMRRVWEGWEIRWAHEGIVDIAEYVGVPRAQVLCRNSEPTAAAELRPPDDLSWTTIVGSVRLHDGLLRLYPLSGELVNYLSTGPSLLALATQQAGRGRLALQDLTEEFPQGGFDINETDRTIDFWTTNDTPDALSRVVTHWPGWQVRWHRDDFRVQLVATGGSLTFPVVRHSAIVRQLREALLSDRNQCAVEGFLGMIDALKGNDIHVSEVNPNALRDARIEVPLLDRHAVFEDALQRAIEAGEAG